MKENRYKKDFYRQREKEFLNEVRESNWNGLQSFRNIPVRIVNMGEKSTKRRIIMEEKIKGAQKGTVKFFDANRGFGFIYQDNDQSEIFFHITDVIDNEILKEGQRVSFNLGSTSKGVCAVDVTARQLLEEQNGQQTSEDAR